MADTACTSMCSSFTRHLQLMQHTHVCCSSQVLEMMHIHFGLAADWVICKLGAWKEYYWLA